MHRSSYLRMEYLVKYYEAYFTKGEKEIRVLDIGSYNMGGTYKEIFQDSRYQYVGMDMAEGPNVDFIPRDIYYWEEIEDETFDLVISGQAFEHIEYPWLTIREIARVLKPSGFCILIAPNSGMEHKTPKDCWRYFGDGLVALAKWADLKVHHTSVSGVPQDIDVKDWLSEWNDACLVAQKAPAQTITGEPFVQERRIPLEDTASCKEWEAAVGQAVKGFTKEAPIALFGAGWIGDMVLEILGGDRVSCFVDTAKGKTGKEHRGKMVLSFEDYLPISDRYNCIVTASCGASLEIKKKLKNAGIECRTLYLDNKK